MLIFGENPNKTDQSLSTQPHLQRLSGGAQMENTQGILILGEVSEERTLVPEHSQRFKSLSAAPEQDNTRVTLIIGENSEQ